MSWAHKQDPEWGEFVAQNATRGGALLLGRITYEMMASYWPTKAAFDQNPAVAASMARMPKYVASRTLSEPDWANTRVLQGELVEQVAELKQHSENDLVILGSGSIVAQLTSAGLVDEYQLVLNPLILGRGRALFDGANIGKMPLVLRRSRVFGNGNVVLWYGLDR